MVFPQRKDRAIYANGENGIGLLRNSGTGVIYPHISPQGGRRGGTCSGGPVWNAEGKNEGQDKGRDPSWQNTPLQGRRIACIAPDVEASHEARSHQGNPKGKEGRSPLGDLNLCSGWRPLGPDDVLYLRPGMAQWD